MLRRCRWGSHNNRLLSSRNNYCRIVAKYEHNGLHNNRNDNAGPNSI